MGRYYAREGGRLYVYVTRNDPLIDLDLFPPDLGLFTEGAARRVKEKIAIVEAGDSASLDRAEMILIMNGYRRGDHSAAALNHYYAVGDESVIEGGAPVPRRRKEIEEVRETSVEEMDVIIPDTLGIPPAFCANSRDDLSDGSELNAKNKEGTELSEKEDESPGLRLASEEELIGSLVECMERLGFQFRYEYSHEKKEQDREPPVPTKSTLDEDRSTKLLTELTGLLAELVRERREARARPSLDNLLVNLNEYLETKIRVQGERPEDSGRRTRFIEPRRSPDRRGSSIVDPAERYPRELINLFLESRKSGDEKDERVDNRDH